MKQFELTTVNDTFFRTRIPDTPMLTGEGLARSVSSIVSFSASLFSSQESVVANV
jgi:hypothetical protein